MDLGWLSNIDIGALMALPLLGLIGSGARGVKVGGKIVGGKMSASGAAKVDALRAGMGGAGVDAKDKARAQQQLRDVVQSANKKRMETQKAKPATTPRAPKPAGTPQSATAPTTTPTARRQVGGLTSGEQRKRTPTTRSTTRPRPDAGNRRRLRDRTNP